MDRLHRIWKFIRSRIFLYNILGAIAFYVVAIVLFALFVKSYTKHGDTITLPDLKGQTMGQVRKILNERHIDFVIIDSVYDADKIPFSVLDQNPKANAKVKEYRTVYLTVYRKTAPQIKMPDLKNASLKQAQLVLESYGMKVGALIYKPGLAENVVIDQLYKGRPISEGTELPKGSRIDLILENGIGETEVDVPDLIGLSLREARFVLEGSSLNLGAVVVSSSVSGDTLDAIVYKQIPDPAGADNKIRLGEGVDVFVRADNHDTHDD